MNLNSLQPEISQPSAWLVKALGISVGLVSGIGIVMMVLSLRL